MDEHKELRTLEEMVADVAFQKRRAALARTSGTSIGKEPPREVYLAACASIGASLETSHGFRYSNSGQHATRRSGDFTFRISFQSDRNNVAGERVGLWIHGNVLSPKLKKCLQTQQLKYPSDFVAGGQIGNLQEQTRWLDWHLADPVKRDSVIDDAIRTIQKLAIPYFARFENLPVLFDSMVHDDFPSTWLLQMLDFIMCFAGYDTARLAAVNFLLRRPHLLDEYQRNFERLVGQPLDFVHNSGWAEELAFVSHAFQFGNLITALSLPKG